MLLSAFSFLTEPYHQLSYGYLTLALPLLVLAGFSFLLAYRVWNGKGGEMALILSILVTIMWVFIFIFYPYTLYTLHYTVTGFVLNLVAMYFLTRPHTIALFGKFALPTELPARQERPKEVRGKSIPISTTPEAREKISRVKEIQPKMQIKVFDKGSAKVVRLEAEPQHTVGSLIETLVSGLKLPKGEYMLVLGEREFGSYEYSKTLQSVGIRDGAELELVKRQ